MRALPLLALLLALPAVAQPAMLADLDRRVTTLERTVAAMDGVRLGSGPTAPGAMGTLDAERRDLIAAIADYRAEVDAYRSDATALRAEYDQLATYGGSSAARTAYDEARFSLEDEGRRLVGFGGMLAGWSADLNDRIRATDRTVRPSARTLALRQRIAERRRAEAAQAAAYARARERRIHQRLRHRN